MRPGYTSACRDPDAKTPAPVEPISVARTRPSPNAFYFDLGSPYAYLAGERISGLFAEAGLEQPEWRPILLGGLFRRFERDSWTQGTGREAGMREVERRAAVYGLPPVRWPEPFPANTLIAMRAATYAKSIGRSVSFALAGFRQAFAAGRDLSTLEGVAIAAAACEIHPRALAAAVESKGVKEELRAGTDRAGDQGIVGVPALLIDEEVFWGDDRLAEAVAAAGGR